MQFNNKLKMILTAECGDQKVTVEIPFDSDIHEFVSACQTLAIGMTYHQSTWARGIQQLADELDWDNNTRIDPTLKE